MTELQNPSPNTDTNVSELLDEFASGPPNRPRLLAVRLVGWLFAPPHFPSGLIWFLFALIASTLAVELLPQPASYWANPSLSTYYSFIGIPFKWGIWSIGIHLVLMLLVSAVLSLINKKPAFILWIALTVYHLISITESFRCGTVYFFFETPGNCAGWHSASIVLAGVVWGLILWIIARFGLLPWINIDPETPDVMLSQNKNLRLFSVSWIALLGAAMVFTAFMAPKPEWRPLQSAHIPPGRTEAALAYDSQRSAAVLFGGPPVGHLSQVGKPSMTLGSGTEKIGCS